MELLYPKLLSTSLANGSFGCTLVSAHHTESSPFPYLNAGHHVLTYPRTKLYFVDTE
jgi:hypothetical protein